MAKTLMQMLLDAGYPRAECYSHESDLYVFKTPLTTDLIKKWFKEQNYNLYHFVSEFDDQITGRKMYDIAFAYDPYWQGKGSEKINGGVNHG